MKRRTVGLVLAGISCLSGFAAAQAPPPGPPRDTSFPTPRTEAGKPIESRPPEFADDKPAFAGQTRAPYRKTVEVKVATLTTALRQPWSLAFLPGGRMLVTERAGTMRIVDAAGKLSEPIANVPQVDAQATSGLLDVALSARFAADKTIFFSYSGVRNASANVTTIARATLDEPGLALKDVKVIFRAAPAIEGRPNNQASRLAVAKDGTLFATIGDRSISPPWDVAQKLDTHLGKIIHITADGAPAPGNPFVGRAGALPEIWSVGHRNELGLAFDPAGRLWETENGPRGGDELNLIQPGKNYGWPAIVHGIDYPGGPINGGATAKAGMEQPRYYWDPVIAPSGLAFYQGALFPQWRGSVLVGALRGMLLDRLTLRNGKVVDEEPLLVDMKSRIRDVRVGPDGAVYVLTEDGKLLKLTPK
jgi:glucose/arabinose dehydrogenase